MEELLADTIELAEKCKDDMRDINKTVFYNESLVLGAMSGATISHKRFKENLAEAERNWKRFKVRQSILNWEVEKTLWIERAIVFGTLALVLLLPLGLATAGLITGGAKWAGWIIGMAWWWHIDKKHSCNKNTIQARMKRANG